MLTLDCHTIREIEHQPRMWMDTFRIIRERKADIERFLADNQITKQTRTVLTGAGTSAFVADTAACLFMQDGYGQTRSVATTDIVSAPCSFLSPEDKLFVSFARSGNSPESVAAYRIARKFCKDARHLIITCNPDGCLAKEAEPGKDLVIVLPDGTNDRSLAMTSSFTSMLIACLLCKNIQTLDVEEARLKAAAAFASHFLEDAVTTALREMTAKNIYRAVFLGSGALKGIACESHLKLQELTDGQIMCSFDSFMGLRHGPKAVVNERTLVVYLLSDDPYTRRYELDLIDQVGKEINIKYFDPSYMVRSIPAQGTDAIFCFQLAEAAVHAGMAGKTDMVVGSMNEQFSHVPIEYAVNERKKIDPNGTLWHAVLGATRQQDYFSGKGKGNK